jgi:para-nitrobenzyl esterase
MFGLNKNRSRQRMAALALLGCAGLLACGDDDTSASSAGAGGSNAGAGGSNAGGSSAGASAGHAAGGGGAGGSLSAQSGLAIKISTGPIQGKMMGSTRQFLGIPYAKPPTGDLRFAPPQPAAAWSAMRDATAFGPGCPQPSGTLSATGTIDEDCLSVNVYSPADTGDKALPVMVFIHGGAFTTGASSQYDGTSLSETGPAVVVSLNYRLGALGFFSDASLDGTRSGKPSGSDGLRDQQLALHWVQDNIAAFGGDPKNVTVFGESAGSLSACLHMLAPSSQGLAKRFIMESGSCVGSPLGALSKDASNAIGKKLEDALCSGQSDVIACLRSKSADDLVNWGSDMGLFGAGWSATVEGDGGVLTDTPDKLLAANSKLPSFIIGTNKNEWGLFQLLGSAKQNTVSDLEAALDTQFGDKSSLVKAQYHADSDDQANDVYIRLITDISFRCPTRSLARSAITKGASVYLYSFEHGKSFHAEELDYVFGNANLSTLLSDGTPPASLTTNVQDYWTQFAQAGDPNGGDNPNWPPYDMDGDKNLTLDAPPATSQGLSMSDCDFWVDFVKNGGTISLGM